MIDELAHHASLFLAYQDFKGAMRDMSKAFVDVFVDIFTFAAHALKFLQENRGGEPRRYVFSTDQG